MRGGRGSTWRLPRGTSQTSKSNISNQTNPKNPERLARCRSAFGMQCFRNCTLSSLLIFCKDVFAAAFEQQYRQFRFDLVRLSWLASPCSLTSRLTGVKWYVEAEMSCICSHVLATTAQFCVDLVTFSWHYNVVSLFLQPHSRLMLARFVHDNLVCMAFPCTHVRLWPSVSILDNISGLFFMYFFCFSQFSVVLHIFAHEKCTAMFPKERRICPCKIIASDQ